MWSLKKALWCDVALLAVVKCHSAGGDAGSLALHSLNVVSASMIAMVAAEISFLSPSASLLYSAVFFSMKPGKRQRCHDRK